MKKRLISSIIIVISFVLILFTSFAVQARSLSATEMKQRLTDLKLKYPTGWKWEDGWCVDYTIGNCGPGYNKVAWECMGFAYKICNELFDEEPRTTFYTHSNIDNLCVGDYVRRNGHSFVVTNISGNTVFYVDCNGYNGYGYNVVCWERSMSKSALSSGLEHIKTQRDNWIKTLDDIAVDAGCKWQVTGTDGINIRSGPGTSFSKVGAIAYQQYFTITRRKTAEGYTWGAVTYGGVSGWCVLDYAMHISGTLPILETETTYDAIHKDSEAHISNGIYTFKNVQSGLAMDVTSGADTNGNPVTVYGYNGTNAQLFRVQHNGDGKYYLYAKCSSDGNGRVLDIMRTNNSTSGVLQDGCYVDIYDCNDSAAQLFYIYPVGDGKYVIELDAAQGRVVSPVDSSSANTESSQLYLKDYNGSDYQKWYLCDSNGIRIDRKISSITVKNMPNKTEYFVNDNFDLTGLVLVANYSDGSTEIISSGIEVLYDFSEVGTKEVIIKYNSLTTTLNVRIKSIELTSLEMRTFPTKTKYYVGENIDTSGLELTAMYNNGTTEMISSGFTTSYDFTTPGTKTVTVTYEGKSVTYDVEVTSVGNAELDVEATENAQYGDEITFAVNLSSSENIYDGNFNIVYDNSVLKYKNHSIGTVLQNKNAMLNSDYAENKIRTTFAGTSELESGNMLNVTFEVIADTDETTEIKLEDISMYNLSGTAVAVSGNLSAGCNITTAVTETVAVPVASVSQGNITSGTKIELSTETNGAEIYYTTDGTEPTVSSTKYTGAITVNDDMTIKAVAVKSGITSSMATFVYTVLSENSSKITVSEKKAKAGDTVDITLDLSNNPGIAGMILHLSHDEELTLTQITKGDALNSLVFTVPKDMTKNPCTLLWDGVEADNTNGTILTLTFLVDEEAPEGTYDISLSYSNGDIFDNDLNDVDISIINGNITVKNAMIGDLNNDEIINAKDITLLRRYISGDYGVEADEYVVDVNKDGLVNAKDITIPRRFVSGDYGIVLE